MSEVPKIKVTFRLKKYKGQEDEPYEVIERTLIARTKPETTRSQAFSGKGVYRGVSD